MSQGKLEQCTGPGPAALAGIRSGDVVVKVGDTPVSSFDEMAAAVRKSHGSVPIVVERDGTAIVTYVDIESTQRWILTGRAVSSSRQRSVRLGWAPPGSGLCATACSPPCRPHSRSPAT